MKYHEKTVSLFNTEHKKVAFDVDMDIRLTNKVKAELVAKHMPDAVEFNTYTQWNNTDEFLRCSFRSGMNFLVHELIDGVWVKTRQGTYTRN